MKDQYPLYKKLAWRFIRTGLWGGISSALSLQLILQPDFSNIKIVAMTILAAFLTGFFTSAGMAAREYFSEGDKDSMAQKLVI